MALVGPSLLAAGTGDTEVRSFEIETLFESGIEAHITLLDTGDTNVYVGVATGMTENVLYVSLIYDTDSEEDGVGACEPGIDPDTPLTGAQMFIGIWLPENSVSGIRTLVMFNDIAESPPPPIPDGPVAEKTLLNYTPIDDIGTMSVRDGSTPMFDVVACGEID